MAAVVLGVSGSSLMMRGRLQQRQSAVTPPLRSPVDKCRRGEMFVGPETNTRLFESEKNPQNTQQMLVFLTFHRVK